MKRKIKDTILAVITIVMFMIFIVSISAMDSDTWIQYITLLISTAWLALVAYANGEWGL